MENDNTLFVEVIDKAIKLPGVKVNRDEFLMKIFSKESPEMKKRILANGPINAGYGRDTLKKKAKKVVNDCTLISTSASFVAGLPGGLAMAGTIPADTMQFFGVALRLIQELAYLYGDDEVCLSDTVDDEDVLNRIILYIGVMFGVSGSAATLKITSSLLAKQILKKLPQKALTKTVYYPIVKKIALSLGIRMNKNIFAKGVAKSVPLLGGVVSGGITLATMRPMGLRVVEALEDAMFSYSEEDFNCDLEEVINIIGDDAKDMIKQPIDVEFTCNDAKPESSLSKHIKEAKELLDQGIITEEEFVAIKAKLIENL